MENGLGQLPFCKYEARYRREKPETIGEESQVFDRSNYSDWLECRVAKLELALEAIRENTTNPAKTMTKLGLEEVVDACHRIATREL